MNSFLAASPSGVNRAAFKSSGHWSVESVLNGTEITCLASDPIRKGVVYAGTRGNGLLCSVDCGRTWSSTGLAGQTVKAVSASSIVSGLLYAGTKPACMFRSTDGGKTWEELPAFRQIPSRRFWFSPAETPFTAYVQGIALSPTDPDRILVGIEAGAVVQTLDGGKTWKDHRAGALRDCHSIQFHHNDGSWVYEAGGTGAGAAISRDGGSTWTQTKSGLDRHYGWACASHPLQPEICYVSVSPSPTKAHSENNAQAYLFRSNSRGEWERLGGGLPQPLNSMPYALITEPEAPDHVYAGLQNGDVWQSTDRGNTWSQMPFNLKSIHRSMILIS